MLANLVCSLIKHRRVTTTLAKAKAARSVAEKMITLGKAGTLHDRRLASARLHQDEDAVKVLFNEIAPTQKERRGGYTRIVRLGPAPGRRRQNGHPGIRGCPVPEAAPEATSTGTEAESPPKVQQPRKSLRRAKRNPQKPRKRKRPRSPLNPGLTLYKARSVRSRAFFYLPGSSERKNSSLRVLRELRGKEFSCQERRARIFLWALVNGSRCSWAIVFRSPEVSATVRA